MQRSDVTWQQLVDEGMTLEQDHANGARALFEQAMDVSVADMQRLLDVHPEVATQVIESLYGALIAGAQAVMTRFEDEHEEVDRSFLVGQAYGISAVMNHVIDRLTDRYGISSLEQLDILSDAIHNEILDEADTTLVKLALKDAKGTDI